MNRKLILLTGLLCGTLTALGGAQVGEKAPGFEAKDIHGNTHELSDYEGQIVVLESYNLDCPYVKNHYNSGAMQALQKKATEQGVAWLVVNSVNANSSSYRSPEQAQSEAKKVGMNATAWLQDSSGKIGKKYGMKTTPHMYVIDKEGTLVYQGAIDDNPYPEGDPRKAKNYVWGAIQSLKAGEEVEVSRTRPYGCGVKY